MLWRAGFSNGHRVLNCCAAAAAASAAAVPARTARMTLPGPPGPGEWQNFLDLNSGSVAGRSAMPGKLEGVREHKGQRVSVNVRPASSVYLPAASWTSGSPDL
ncbi:hypothetical protein A5N16_15235 [Arthrobacter sp. M6]|nr:hypothetical protein [Arthrobacter sp. M6]